MDQELEKQVVEKLAQIGLQEGQTVLDFGCGSGNYTIPAAKVVGKSGTVYAVDKSEDKLSDVKRRAKQQGLRNIHPQQVSRVDDIGLEEGSVDVVLLYDIFWYFPLTDPKLDQLLDAISIILKPNGVISVYPKHIDEDKLKEKIECAGFILANQNCGTILHEGRPEEGCLLNFKRNDLSIIRAISFADKLSRFNSSFAIHILDKRNLDSRPHEPPPNTLCRMAHKLNYSSHYSDKKSQRTDN